MLRPSTALALLFCAAAAAGAQNVQVSAGGAHWSATGTTVTAAFTIVNQRSKPVQTIQRIDLPPDWRLVTGNAPLVVKPSESALLMVSVMVPVKTRAGAYRIRVAAFDAATDKFLGEDSLGVIVAPRRAIDVALANSPSFVISGRNYDVDFVVRNRGNEAATVRVKARSSLGSAFLDVREIRMAPDEARTLHVRVNRATSVGMAADDVAELIAAVPGDSLQKRASARVTVVPPSTATIDDYQRVPTQVAVRAANASGVSPYVVTGGGRLTQGGATSVDFLFRGRPGPESVFGDRDEYRVDFRAPSWRLRAGDNLFSVSQLTSGAQEGAGLGAEKRFGAFGVGAYAENFRRMSGGGQEGGAFISANPAPGLRLAMNGVNRINGPFSGKIGSVSANLQRENLTVEAEVARSADSVHAGVARMLHASGTRGGVAFDLGHVKADSGFLGPQRGSEHNYLSAGATPVEHLALNVSASSHSSRFVQFLGIAMEDRLNLASGGVTIANLLTIEAAGASHYRRDVVRSSERQTSLRARFAPQFGPFGAALAGEVGRAAIDSTVRRGFTDVSLNVGFNGSRGSITAFGGQYSGGSVVKGSEPSVTLGGSASLRIGDMLDATMIASANRLGTIDRSWFGNIDAQLSHTLRTGATLTLRTRMFQGPAGNPGSPVVAYLEYAMPIGLPVSRLRTPGRANGRVLDAATGRGVANALVRLGPQVGITDRSGRVHFGGLPAGEHRVSLSQETSYADVVFLGDPTLRVDSGRGEPATFTLRIARGARVEISARRFVIARTGMAGAADSLADAGPLVANGFRLLGERDTLYRTTDENGRVSFNDVAPGKWIVEADGDVPTFHRFAPERVEIVLSAGETRSVGFRLIPRAREVKIINDTQEVQVVPAEPKVVPMGTPPRTAHPEASRR